MAALMLSVMGAAAEFERSLIRARHAEGIGLAKRRGVYRGRERSLSPAKQAELRVKLAAGETKSRVAADLGISRQSVHRYLPAAEDRTSLP